MHGQAAEVYCASLVNEDSYEAPYLNIDRERRSVHGCLAILVVCLSPPSPSSLCLPVQCRKPPQNAECKQCVTQAGRQAVGQSATIRERSLTMFVVQVWEKERELG